MLIPIIFSIAMFPGMFMTFIPFMPALPYMFVIAVLFGFFDGFEKLTLVNLSILGGILILSILVDYFSGIIGARYGGASRKGIFFGFIGLIAGLLIFPPFGGFLGLFVGVLFAEFAIKKSTIGAIKASTGSFLGSLTGILINTFLAVLFFTLFLIFVFVVE
jgi:uncharacterized protein